MKLFSCILFILSFTICFAQQDFDRRLDSILTIENQDLRIEYLDAFKKDYSPKNTKLYAKICYKLAVEYYDKEEYTIALKNVHKAISIQKSIANMEILDVQKSIYLSTLCYRYLDDLQNEIKYLAPLLNTTTYTNPELKAMIRSAKIHSSLGDYYTAMEFFDKVLNSYPIHKNEDRVFDAHFEKLITYSEMSPNDTTFLATIEYHKQELEKRKESFYPEDELILYNTMALIYRGYKNREQSLTYFQKALETVTSETLEEELNSIHINIGEIYSKLGKSEKAIHYFQKVLKTTDSINRSAANNNLGYYHASTVKNEIEYHQKAIALLDFDRTIIGTSSFLETIKDFQFKKELLTILIDLSQAWIKLYEENGNKNHLQEALKTIYAIDDLISVMRLDSGTKLSKLFWIEKGVNSYLEGVKICYLLNKPDEAFYFMEKNKSLYLLEQLGKIQLKNQYKIPNSLLEKEISLKYEVLLAENKLKTTPNSTSFQNTYKEAEQKYFKFKDSLKNTFPDYYESNLKPKLVTLQAFQDFLKEKHTNAVEYILGEKEGFGLWMNGTEIRFFPLENYSNLLTDISFLKQIFTNSSLTKKEVDQYKKTGFKVFSTLFPWKEAIAHIKTKQLAIIPDGVLYNFPFEALIITEKPVLKENYFINIAEVSYLNSASVSQNLFDAYTAESYSYLGIAPVHFKSETLLDLKNSENITKQIAALFSSETRVREAATRAEFLKSSQQKGILHINTHAGIDNKTKVPWLALHDTLISLKDIYIMNRSHALVFLDACKTGDGKLQKGEGIESLSRAFFHAGAKSVIASQWNANEKATNEISVSFFKALKQGNSKSSALRKAKLAYLSQHELSGTFPYFWASLTLTGNSDGLPAVSYTYYWVFFGGVFCFLCFLYYLKRKRIIKL
ncbi:MAG: CHAT domain-containing protein [Kordia sp.]|uniref:CHAT domain-containing protein n=1 Tax=Kordia sp. TaxID=1965332 RepID=UPI003858CE32